MTYIGHYAFYGTSLTFISIPNSVTYIGSSAFYNTPWLNNQPDGCVYAGSCLYEYKGKMPENTHIDIKEGTTQICTYAFDHCTSLTSISIPNSVTSIDFKAFTACSSLTSILIPNNVTEIGEYAFSDCSSLSSITIEATTPPTLGSEALKQGIAIYIPDNTLSAYKSAWGTDYVYVNNETSLTINVEIPGTLYDLIFDAGQRPIFVTKLTVTGTLNDDDFTCMRETMTSLIDVDLFGITNTTSVNFELNKNLVKIILPNNLTSIDKKAFYSCSSLSSITIPNSVTSIGNYAFQSCSSLTSITIPNSVTSIGNYAFQSCSSLTSITIPNSVIEIGENAFRFCSSLTSITIPNSVTSIGEYTFYSCSSLTSITIGNSVTSIGDKAFYSCSSLTSITIGNSVTEIGEYAFKDCSNLTDVYLKFSSNENLCYNDVNRLLVNALLGNEFKSHRHLIVDDKEITKYIIPDTTTVIKKYAFDACSFLTSITIPNSVTSIGWDAFTGCSSLTSITIPNSVTSIGNSAFYGYSSLDTITCLGSTPPIAENLGANTKTCVLVVPKEAYSDYLRHTYWGQFLTILTIGDKEIKTEVNNSAWGKVTGAGVYNENDEATLTATANSGYRFVKWSDGNTDNPRTIIVTQDSTFSAEFALEEFALYATSASPELGYVKHTIEAIAIEGFEFDRWSDGNTDNPRTIILTEDTKLYAYFQIAQGGTPVDLETSKISSANIYTTNGTLHIEGVTNDYHVLDAAGRLIYSGNATTLTLPRGIYLITMGGEVEKIVL